MIRGGLAFVAASLCAAAFAQPSKDAGFEVRGTVRDFETGQAIPNAYVVMTYQPPPKPGFYYSHCVKIAGLHADSEGRYALKAERLDKVAPFTILAVTRGYYTGRLPSLESVDRDRADIRLLRRGIYSQDLQSLSKRSTAEGESSAVVAVDCWRGLYQEDVEAAIPFLDLLRANIQEHQFGNREIADIARSIYLLKSIPKRNSP